MEKLIEAVKQHPCLWQLTNGDHRCVFTKRRSWEMVSAQLNKPVGVVKKEWKGLRNGLRQAMRSKKARSGVADSNVKPWRYEKQLEFLKPYANVRTFQSSLSKEATSTQNNGAGNVQSADIKQEVIKEENVSAQATACPYKPPENLATSCLSNTRKRQNIKKEITCSDRIEYLENVSQHHEQSDDLALFFKSMYESTRKMPIIYQIHMKKQLMGIILTAQEQLALQTSCNSLSSSTNQSWHTPSSSSVCQQKKGK